MAMQKRLTKKERFFNNINLTADDEVYVGIDVHKVKCHVAIWLNNGIALTFVTPSDNLEIAHTLGKLTPALKQIVYEAGPTGFSLARTLEQASLPVAVIAPSKTLRPAAVDSKSDRLDCRKLAEFASKDLLVEVAIPTEQEEADRQVVRLRNQLRSKLVRIKQQIKSFLLQHSIPYPIGLDRWTLKSVAKLKRLKLCSQKRFALNMLIDQLEYFQKQIKDVDAQLRKIFKEKHHTRQMEVLESHPGIGPITARQYRVEVFSPERFEKSTQLTRYLGLCPRVSQSGQKRIEGRLMKAGQIALRANLIEAAWVWIRLDPAAKETFNRLLSNTGEPNKAITAMARRLAIHLWKMLCDDKMYQKAA
jgi:transposase